MAAELQAQVAITTLNPNDVLLGRGSGFSQWRGNMQMRELVEKKRREYVAARNKQKSVIAEQIVDKIHSLGGRFLRLEESAEEVEFILEEGTWIEAERDAATEKVKQCLRQKRKPLDGSKKRALSESEDSYKESENSDTDARLSTSIPGLPVMAPEGFSSGRLPSVAAKVSNVHSLATLPSTLPSFLPSTLHGNGNVPSLVDPRLSLLLTSPFFLRSVLPDPTQVYSMASFPSQHLAANIMTPTTAQQLQSQVYARPDLHFQLSSSGLSRNSTDRLPRHESDSRLSTGKQGTTGIATIAKRNVQGFVVDGQGAAASRMATESSSAEVETEVEVSKYLLSALALSDRPMFTEEQEARERAEMANAERAQAFSDMFGKNRASDFHESKRPRRDLDNDSIEFLVKQMRVEIEAIPDDQKQALTEARAKARAEEFSDERLMKFLRCEGMNTKLAAQRFVNYWESRRNLFGPTKYLKRMTLGEALCDDLVALEAGYICLLPHCDVAGRPIVHSFPSRHTREGYTAESMLRACWYTIEVAAQGNDDTDNNIVEVMWSKGASLFDYDRTLHDLINYYRDNAWPVKVAALHVCCASGFIIKIVKPIIMAIKSKSSRYRTLFHNVSDSEILDTLSKYGILPYMLPTEMGGTVQVDQSEWIARRRALEMEEIA